MIRKHQSLLNLVNVLSDFVLIVISFFVAQHLRFNVLRGHISMRNAELMLTVVALVCAGALVFVYYMAHVYAPQRRRQAGSCNLRIIIINAAGAMGLMAFCYMVRLIDFSRLSVFLFWLLSSILVILKHTLLHALLHFCRVHGYNLKHYILIGAGHLAAQYLEDVKQNPYTGVVVDGYVSGVQEEGYGTYLGHYDELERILDEKEYDGLIVALDPSEIGRMNGVLAAADKEGIAVEMIPFYNDYYPAHPTIDSIGRTKLVNMRATPLDSLFNSVLKRTMDICGSAILLVVLSPVMLLLALGVKLSSPGPVFFSQERIGRGKKPFRMHKFRSMRNDIDHDGWTTDNDPRKTRFGSFIRKYSLDELPQLWDVFTGSMSLIGPRPEIPKYVHQFKEEIPLYLVRQQVRPGMTGWAQVNGLRGDTSIEERVKYDIWYIENWSLSLDIKILFMTAFGGAINSEKIVRKQK